MADDHSALLAQLDSLTSADSAFVFVFAELIRAGLQALIGAEATEKPSPPATTKLKDRSSKGANRINGPVRRACWT